MSSYQKRRISEQTYKFPKCIFPFFFSIHDIYIYFVYDVVQLELRCCWSMKKLCAVCTLVSGGVRKKRERERAEKRKMKRADWEKLRKINMWVIRKHKYWMFRVCECEAHRAQNHFIRLCQSWRIYGASYVFNSWRQKRKQNEGILLIVGGKT